LETNTLVSLGISLRNEVVRVFIRSAYRALGERVKLLVQLQDDVRARIDIVIALVYCGENIAVSGDFLLCAVARRGLVPDEDYFSLCPETDNAKPPLPNLYG
jgi:hypothetical protein